MSRILAKASCGSVMIVSLSLLVLFAMLAVGLGYRSGMEARLVRRHLDLFREKYLTQAAVTAVQYLVEKDEESDVDGPFDDWYNEPVWPEIIDLGEFTTVYVTDEESKVNINYAGEGLLKVLFELVDEEEEGLETEVDDLVAGILHWRGDSAVRGGTAIGHKQKGAPFESLEELLLIKDITPEDARKIRPYLTAYGLGSRNRPFINPNTASPIVLEALVTSLVGDQGAKEDIIDSILYLRHRLDEGEEDTETEVEGEAEEDALTYFSKEDLAPQNLLLKLELTGDVKMMALANQLSLYLTVDARFFNIEVEVKENESSLGMRSEVVIGPPVHPASPRGLGRGRRGRRRGLPLPLTGGELIVLNWRDS